MYLCSRLSSSAWKHADWLIVFIIRLELVFQTESDILNISYDSCSWFGKRQSVVDMLRRLSKTTFEILTIFLLATIAINQPVGISSMDLQTLILLLQQNPKARTQVCLQPQSLGSSSSWSFWRFGWVEAESVPETVAAFLLCPSQSEHN